MSATITRGYSFGSTEQVTNSKLHTLVDSAIITGISNDNIASDAAISLSKINLTTAGINYDKLNLDGSVVNDDIADDAAIAYSKLNLTGSVTNGDLAGSIADSKLSTISTADKVSGAALTSLGSIPSGAGQIPSANLSISGSGSYSFSAYHSTTQDTSGTTPLNIAFDTEDFDTGSNFASSTFTAPANGKYLFTVNLDIITGSATWTGQLYIYKNGNQFSTLSGAVAQTTNAAALGGSIIMNLSTNDTVNVYITRTSGSGNLTINGGATKSRFTGTKLA